MTGASGADEPRIIVDEDWKSKVQAEKEQLERGRHGESTAPPEPPTAESPAEASRTSELPPASLPALISLLASQAFAAFDPQAVGGQTGPPDLVGARYFIDMLQVLEDKTRGNRSPAEDQLLTGLLHELRMVFVAAKEGTN